jgi:hypothetical protein
MGKIGDFGKSSYLSVKTHLLALLKTFAIEKNYGVTFTFADLANFEAKFFSKVYTSGHSGSNDTGLKSLSCLGPSL